MLCDASVSNWAANAEPAEAQSNEWGKELPVPEENVAEAPCSRRGGQARKFEVLPSATLFLVHAHVHMHTHTCTHRLYEKEQQAQRTTLGMRLILAMAAGSAEAKESIFGRGELKLWGD